MDDKAIDKPHPATTVWRPAPTYVMALVCLMVGLIVGYLVRGSSVPSVRQVPLTAASQPVADPHTGMGQQGVPTMEDMQRMANKKAEPLLAKLKSDPNNAQLLNQVGIIYRSAHQFKQAEEYFQKSLQVDPKNVDVRTDMAATMYYTGDVDGSIAQLEKGLSYNPKHAGALMNLGIIRWKGKNDAPGAVALWEKLLKLNPHFPQKDVVQHMISEAQQTQKEKPGA